MSIVFNLILQGIDMTLRMHGLESVDCVFSARH